MSWYFIDHPPGPDAAPMVLAFADSWSGDLGILINNAGVMDVLAGVAAPVDRCRRPGSLVLASPHLTGRTLPVERHQSVHVRQRS
jgi:hypothetical protein